MLITFSKITAVLWPNKHGTTVSYIPILKVHMHIRILKALRNPTVKDPAVYFYLMPFFQIV